MAHANGPYEEPDVIELLRHPALLTVRVHQALPPHPDRPHFMRTEPRDEEYVPRTTLEEAYAERNTVVLAFAHMAQQAGWIVGRIVDPDEPEWPVLMIDTPEGQMSWHFKKDDLPLTIPPYPGEWDGHTTPEKYECMDRLIGRSWGAHRG